LSARESRNLYNFNRFLPVRPALPERRFSRWCGIAKTEKRFVIANFRHSPEMWPACRASAQAGNPIPLYFMSPSIGPIYSHYCPVKSFNCSISCCSDWPKSQCSFFLIKKNKKIKTYRKNNEIKRLITLKILQLIRQPADSNRKNFARSIRLNFICFP
jgi:hypothetical protein